MATAKLKTTAILLAACILILLAAVLVLHRTEPAPTPPIATAPSTTADDPLALYAPSPDEPLKFLSPSPEDRRAVYRHFLGPDSPAPKGRMIIQWDHNHAYLSDIFTRSPIPAKTLFPLLLPRVLHLYSQDVELAPTFPTLHLALPGDIIGSPIAPHEQTLPRFEAILTDEIGLPIKLSLRTVPVKAIVFTGHWNSTPNPAAPQTPPPLIEIFSTTIEPTEDPTQDDLNNFADTIGNYVNHWKAGHPYLSTPKDLADALGEYLNRDVFIEADNVPNTLRYQFNDGASYPQTPNHITEQTALTWHEETRTVRHVFVEAAPNP